MPSEAFDNIVGLLRATELPEGMDGLADMRAGYALLGSMVPPAEGAAVEAATLNGAPGEWVTPAEVDGDRTILYLHGGGYNIGSAESHRGLTTHLATKAKAKLFTVDYRLAPEHPYPAAVDDAVAAYRGLLDAGTPASSIVVAGDSAGGGLAVAVLLRLRDEGVALPAACVPISPWVDLTNSGSTLTELADIDPMVTPEALEMWAASYLVGTDPKEPYASPLHGDLAGLPPLFIAVGDQEVLLDDSRRLAAQADAAGVEAELVVAPDMIHVWPFFADLTPESAEGIATIAAWVVGRTS